jgi:hypothetical protein
MGFFEYPSACQSHTLAVYWSAFLFVIGGLAFVVEACREEDGVEKDLTGEESKPRKVKVVFDFISFVL